MSVAVGADPKRADGHAASAGMMTSGPAVDDQVIKLQTLLGITDADLEAFSTIGENLVTRLIRRKAPPNSTKAS